MEWRRALYPVLLLAGASFSTSASAADWYVGGSVGRSQIEVSTSAIEQGFQEDDDFVATDTSLDDADVGWKLFIGYRLLPILSLEAGYLDLGRATFDTTIVDAPPPFDAITPFEIRARAEAAGPHLSGVLHLPLTPRLQVMARAGLFRWKADFTERLPDTGTTRVDRSEDDVDLQYGVGVQLALNEAFGARFEWERLADVGEGIGGRTGRDVDFFSLGLTLGF
jgi:OOP family OmpA-OmpF porin